MCWGPGTALLDRFNGARSCLVGLYPARRRPGGGYGGFIDRLTRHNARLLQIVTDALRQRSIDRAGRRWRTHGFVVMGVDGTRIAVPRTDRNIKAIGVANKANAGPEMLLTCLFHLATRTLWSFTHDRAAGSERGLLPQMLPCLPADSLVVADAGFVGWNTIKALTDAGGHLVIRAGANVRVLSGLGHVRERGEGIVHLWPALQQKRNLPPITLRRMLLVDARGRQMCLLTDVPDERRLSDRAIGELYAMRWGVEIAYRWLKGTMQGRKMLSTSPTHARVELDWTMMGLWVLTLLSSSSSSSQNAPGGMSLAGTLRVVREAMTHRRRRGRRRPSLAARFHTARTDGYRRRGPKSKRPWPRRARVHRCGLPLARTATLAEIARYQALLIPAA